MEVTVTQFKAKCLGIIEKVQREKQRVIISRHGKPAAELIPIQNAQPGTLFGRARKTTTIKGDLFTSEETWDARASALKEFRGAAIISAISTWEVSMLEMKNRLQLDSCMAFVSGAIAKLEESRDRE